MDRLLEIACDPARIGVIFNPASGIERPTARRSALQKLTRAAGLPWEWAETDADLGARLVAERALADGFERLIIAGGDGSLTEAASVLAGTDVSLAVVPAGTGNLVALNLGIPTRREAALRLALSGQARPIDIGRANGAAFLLSAGIGLDAHVMRDTDRALKRRVGSLAYLIAALRNLDRPPTVFTVHIDGRRFIRRAQMVLVANLGRVTGGLELVPGTDPDDGLLQVAILRTGAPGDVARLGLRALRGAARSDRLLEVHPGRHILVEARTPQPIQVDGTDFPPTDRLEITVQPASLMFVRPPLI